QTEEHCAADAHEATPVYSAASYTRGLASTVTHATVARNPGPRSGSPRRVQSKSLVPAPPRCRHGLRRLDPHPRHGGAPHRRPVPAADDARPGLVARAVLLL